ncbi:MAG: TRAP transporter large permease subunit, partial [Thermoanaerobaculia bacterium]|nr:TRAP transporter large permease subunit [Thermoanaerobaculia bacterium]
GPVLGQLGVVPLAAHLFIFYFGMMSMVTPPVARAAYTASSIANSGLMVTGFAAFRFALVGFTLPFMFVFRPGLLLMTPAGEAAPLSLVAPTIVIAVVGVVPLAAGIAGYLVSPLDALWRSLSLASAALLLYPGRGLAVGGVELSFANLAGLALLAIVTAVSWRRRSGQRPPAQGRSL